MGAIRVIKLFKDLLDVPRPAPGKVIGWDAEGKLVSVDGGGGGGGGSVDWEALGIYVGTEPPTNLVTHAEWKVTKQGYWGFINVGDLT